MEESEHQTADTAADKQAMTGMSEPQRCHRLSEHWCCDMLRSPATSNAVGDIEMLPLDELCCVST